MASDTWDDLRQKRDGTVNSAIDVAIELIARPSDDEKLTGVRVSLFKALVALANQYAHRMDDVAKRETENEGGDK